MRVLFVGDIVGEPGRKLVGKALPTLKSRLRLDLILANAENVSNGSGMSMSAFQYLRRAGVDGFTMGDHIYRQKEILKLLQPTNPICRSANLPPSAVGPEWVLLETPVGPLALFSLLGRLFMKPMDCPLRAADRILGELQQLPRPPRMIVVDYHAEATSEKQLLLQYLRGRVSAVVGTHTHVPTADAAIFTPGTAYITDIGMTGPYDSIIGRRYDRILKNTLTFEPQFFEVAQQDCRISAVLIDIDPKTGQALHMELIHWRESVINELLQGSPDSAAVPTPDLADPTTNSQSIDATALNLDPTAGGL